MSSQHKIFQPNWYEQIPPERSFRTLFKWGSLNQFKHPNSGLYYLIKDTFGLNDNDFRRPLNLGLEDVADTHLPHLAQEKIEALIQIVGMENAFTDTYSRLKKSYGKAMIDLLRLRQGIIENIPDLVLNPRTTEDVQAILRYCNDHQIPFYVFGGGSSVTRGFEAVKGGVVIDMSVHLNKVVSFSEIDQTITVQAGMQGPDLEHLLTQAPQIFGARHSYTCGHFPQSFEYSSVGGWVVTRGAGQNSTYYGKIEDIVLSQEYVTPIGILRTPSAPRQATGPDINQMMMGSEGCYGVLIRSNFAFFAICLRTSTALAACLKTWSDAQMAVREIMQCEAGKPSVFRLSDPEETDVAMKLYHVDRTPADTLLKALGYKPMERCLLLGSAQGEYGYAHNLRRYIFKICRSYGAFPLTPFKITERWEKDRFCDPYLREDLQDYGILIDTLECAVKWSQLEQVHRQVREVVKSRPQTICMTHLSHAYPQGTNLYFIFIARMDNIKDYLKLQYQILEAIARSGAAISHHHGIGKSTAPWLKTRSNRMTRCHTRTYSRC